MYIKRIRLVGFKTYKDDTTITLTPRYNCIVGLNGSGKSNILNAIAFVMADFCGHSAEDKRSFLHEGASRPVKSASVELIFDNRERTFGLFKQDEVSVRRTVGDGRDEWCIEGKKMLKSVFIEHMESVGFSLNNPYYMVRQGKVAELSQMKDRKRFELLNDIAGVRLYESRRAASLKHLAEKDEELSAADETLKTIKAKTERLEKEQAELREYQDIDSNRRCVEYHYTNLVWKEANVAELEATQQKEMCAKAIGSHIVQLNEMTKSADEAVEKKSGLEEERECLESDHSLLLAQQCESQRSLSGCMCEEEALKEKAAAIAVEKQKKTEQLEELRKEIGATEAWVVARRDEFERLEMSQLDAVQAQRCADTDCTQLRAKRSRSCSYSSRKTRNEALAAEVVEMRRLTEQYMTRQQTAAEQIKRVEEAMAAVATEKENIETRMHEIPDKIEAAAQHSKSVAETLEKLLQHRRRLQQRLSELQKGERTAEKSKHNEDERFYRSMRAPVRQALEEADSWKTHTNLSDDDAPGMLIRNMTVPPAFQIAVETVGRNQLLNYLVADQSTLSRLANHIKNRSAGQLTITPLKELPTTTPPTYPPASDGVQALVECIQCATPAVAAAIKQIFGKVILCDSLATAEQLHCAGWQFEFVTPSGDTLARRGTVAGGFVKEQNLRFRILDEIKKCEATLLRVRREINEVSDELHEADHVHRQQLEGEALGRQQEHALSQELAHLQAQLHECHRRRTRHEQERASLVSQRESDERDIALWHNKIEDLQKEMEGPLGNLTVEEEQHLSHLQSEQKTLESKAEAATNAFNKVRDEVFKAEARLRDTLTAEAQQIEMELLSPAEAMDDDRLVELAEQVAGHKNKMNEVKESIELVSRKLAQKKVVVDEIAKAAVEREHKESEVKKLLLNETKRLNHWQQEIEAGQSAKAAAAARSRGSGVAGVGSGLLDKYKGCTKEQLETELTKRNNMLKRFCAVNKKAVDQYTTFVETYEHLEERRAGIASSTEAVVAMIQALDEKKSNQLKQTFRNLNAKFHDVFRSLVAGGGIAKLTEQKLSQEQVAALQAEEDLKTADSGGPSNKVEETVGIGIKVSFTGSTTSFLAMHQLSGGQKTVVALALLFAIQRCIRAPFYLFDEIDAALDEQYRGAVANEIDRQSREGAQFLITTFRPQLLEPAELLLKVTMRNSCSAVTTASTSEALAVIQEQIDRGEVQ
eukprot:GHVS01085572.1.p1 GENE.GHVS01085572.1~~GHVS01085572.1.p1  ORF type:complete len:1215 (+),score=279.51 GHVS01085572.1:130-3774(+)